MEQNNCSCILSKESYCIVLKIVNTIKQTRSSIFDQCTIVVHYNNKTNNTNVKNNVSIVITAKSTDVTQSMIYIIAESLDELDTIQFINYYGSKRKIYKKEFYNDGLYDYKLIELLDNTYNNTYIIYKTLYDVYILHYEEDNNPTVVNI